MNTSPIDDLLGKLENYDSVQKTIETIKCLTKAIREPLKGSHFDDVWKHTEAAIKTMLKELAICLIDADLADKPK